MNVIDSSGWIEYLADGKNADFFAAPIGDSVNLVTPTICLFEVFKRTLLEMGEEKALDTIGTITFGQIIDLTRDIAIEAARLSAELKLAMADSIILATARAHGAILWTEDVHFKDIEGVKYIEKKGY
jgi:toxin FitB